LGIDNPEQDENGLDESERKQLEEGTIIAELGLMRSAINLKVGSNNRLKSTHVRRALNAAKRIVELSQDPNFKSQSMQNSQDNNPEGFNINRKSTSEKRRNANSLSTFMYFYNYMKLS